MPSILARADSGTAFCGEIRNLLGEHMLALQVPIEKCQRLALVMGNALNEC
ncbi:MAG: hypothetical protein Q7J46_03140 [Pseudomonas sp.]|nr:hypothetical protein [Pseudomonas sp.]